MTPTESRLPAAPRPKYYRNVPTVDLLLRERRVQLRLLSESSVRLIVRVAIGALVVLAAVWVVQMRQDTEANLDSAGEASRKAVELLVDVERGEELQARIDELRDKGDVPAKDYDFLIGKPGVLIDAMRSIFDTQIPGITVLSADTVEPNIVIVDLLAASNGNALAWRTRITEAPGIGRVVTFDSSVDPDDGTIVYTASLVAEGP